ncbi:MAG: HlyD family efflux transporter periplasmic adaptor subunit [Candidatus Sulfotelmatobacter sp.]
MVTAYLSSVRVPIEGTLQGFHAQAGAHVEMGEHLGEIENTRANEERIQDLDVAEQEASAQASAIEKQAMMLKGERQRLIGRAALHARAVSARLALQAAASDKLLGEKQALLDEATTAMRRQQKLRDEGIVSQASLDQVLAEYKVAEQAVAAQQADVAVLKAESDFAKQGILIEQGYGSDVAYSAQRVDEIDLQLANLQQSWTTLNLHADALQSSISATTQYSDLMHRAELLSPTTGTIWQVQAQTGERLNEGQDVVQLIDCRQQFILAAIPQNDVSRMDLSNEARIKLSGDPRVRTGRILDVSEQTGRNEKLAADVPDQAKRTAIVHIAFAPQSDEAAKCWVGQVAQVMLPRKHNGLLAVAFQTK